MGIYEKNMQCDHSRGCSKIKIQLYFGKKKKKSPSFSVLQLMSYTAEVSEGRLLPQAS